jgi:putative transposase
MPGELFRRRKLPHWDVPGATYFITSCLAGSIPATGLADIQRFRSQLESEQRPAEFGEEEWALRLQKRSFARIDDWLDGKPAVRHLQVPELAGIVQESLMFFAGKRLEVFAFVVMPSHFHWVFRPTDAYSQSLTGASARE